MTLAHRVAWNTIAQAAARVGTLALAVLVTVLLTRHLGVSGYGAYVTVTIYVPFFALFFDSGVTTLVVRSLSNDPERMDLLREALGLRLALAFPVAAVVAGVFVYALLLAVLAARRTSIMPIVRPAAWAALLRRALPLGLALMIAAVYFRADALLLSILKGSHAVGIYGVAYRLLEALIAFPGFFYISVFPLLSQAWARRDLANLREVTQRAFDLLVLAAVPVA